MRNSMIKKIIINEAKSNQICYRSYGHFVFLYPIFSGKSEISSFIHKDINKLNKLISRN